MYDGGEVRATLGSVVAHPGHDGVKDLLFRANVQLVGGDDVDELIGRKK